MIKTCNKEEIKINNKERNQNLKRGINEARNELNTNRLDMSYGEIVSMYKRQEIVVDPQFQRLFRWSDYQQTRFIESILLGIPTPPVFMAEDDEGRWEVVDGLQRLSTIFSFFGVLRSEKADEKNNWELLSGEIIEQLKGYKFEDLPLVFQRHIRTAYCRVEIIKWDSNLDMRYELFNRLNTGGSPLTEQEIRNSIFRGISEDFNEYLERLSVDKNFKEIVSLTSNQLSQGYDQELILRISSLYNNWDSISTKNMSNHMTEFMKDAVKNKSFDFKLEKLFKETFEVLQPLGYNIFRFNSNYQFSTSLYDAIILGIANNIEAYKNMEVGEIKEKVDGLKSDDEFRRYTGPSASSKTRVKKRLNRAKEYFKVR